MKPSSDYNVILINLDGLRKDKVELCRSLRLLKENSYYFPKMFTVAPYTFAALPAVFSGIYPSRNGANESSCGSGITKAGATNGGTNDL